MIRVAKPADPPAALRDRGAGGIRELCDAFDQDPAAYRSGAKKLDVKGSIYGHPTVVAALAAAQHRKCCFCERKSLGDVEHFRPKNGFQQSARDPLARPGYYWLAYRWENLFLACGPCNQRFKRNRFTLADPAARATSHHDDLAAERPLLVHPSGDDPEAHVGFRDEIAYPLAGSERGRTCIEILGLNHEELVESRRGFLAIVRVLMENRALLAALIERRRAAADDPPAELTGQLAEIDAAMQVATRAEAEYSSMVKSAVVAAR